LISLVFTFFQAPLFPGFLPEFLPKVAQSFIRVGPQFGVKKKSSTASKKSAQRQAVPADVKGPCLQTLLGQGL
jgi:hypothetical protein